jgi:transcriptional regulator with XRE-family HTH domain
MPAAFLGKSGVRTREELRETRLALGLTRADLSRRAGYSARYVSAVERGHFPLTHAFRQHITAALASAATDRPSLSLPCRCGCGELIVTEPKKLYLNRAHQVRGYNHRKRKL